MCVKPALYLFNSSILALQEDNTKRTQSNETLILGCLNIKTDDLATNNLLDMVSLVNPRFRTTYIKNEKTEQVKCKAMSEMEAILAGQG